MMIDAPTFPRFIYGTAWKENDTARLTELALNVGFRAIDTANQRRHYHEAAVGDGIAAFLRTGQARRDDLFLQTKFTFRRGQDHRLPYDPNAPIATQVEQSFASSLDHLGVDAVDSYVLHGPNQRVGLTADDWSAWRAMESLHDRGLTRFLGISNVSLDQLRLLCKDARVRPRFVQNRCYASQAWDRDVRRFCTANDIAYQGFSLLTANRNELAKPAIAKIAKRHGRTVNQIVFRFAIDVGMIPLTGTTSDAHMREDLDAGAIPLDRTEVEAIENIAAPRAT